MPPRKGKLTSALAVVALASLAAVVSVHSLPARTRFHLGQDYLRFEKTWAKDFPLRRGGSIPALLEPLLFETGVVPVRAEIEPGVSLYLDPRDVIMRTILETGQWEPLIWQAVAAHLPAGAVFLDVGAHIGYDSLKGSVQVGPGGRVVSFEPNPDTLKLLRDNVAASRAANVIIEPIACTDRDEMLTLYGGPPQNIGSSSLSRQNAEYFTKAPPREFSVRGRPIDDVVRELKLDRVDAVKIDVEGAEYDVLRGARETLRRFHPMLVVELIPRQLAGMQAEAGDVFALLQDIGYNQHRQVDAHNWEWTLHRAPPP